MKKSLIVFLFVATIMFGACGQNQADDSVTEETAIKESEEVVEESETQNDLDEENSTIAEDAEESEEMVLAEPEIFTEKCTDTMDYNLQVEVLRPEDVWTLGNHKVYFGQFEGNPVVYRILSPSPDTQTIADNKECLFLDCDSVLLPKEYDADNKKNEGQTKRQNEWKGSDLEEWLNGEEVYGNSSMFSKIEKDAIVSTELAEKSEAYSTGKWTYQDFAATNYIFMLSAVEANQLYAGNAERAKTGSNISWWMRSSFAEAGQGAGAIHADGHLCNNSVNNYSNGVCPAMNVDISKVLFASSLKEERNEGESTIWKLTMSDPEKYVNIADGQAPAREDGENGSIITIPYTYTGNDVTQISVMITDVEYSTAEARVLFYGTLQGADILSASGTGTFVLPAELEEQICGTDYHAYIIAEDVNADKKTDYASEPCEIMIPVAE